MIDALCCGYTAAERKATMKHLRLMAFKGSMYAISEGDAFPFHLPESSLISQVVQEA